MACGLCGQTRKHQTVKTTNNKKIINMKKVFLLIAFVAFICLNVNAQTPIPFAYTGASVEWSAIDSVDSVAFVQLKAFAAAGKYNDSLTVEASGIIKTVLVHGVPSRSGKVEDQVWMVVKTASGDKNYLFNLNHLPKIVETSGVLSISAYRGDSEETEAKDIIWPER
jgi:hypothetical protein